MTISCRILKNPKYRPMARYGACVPRILPSLEIEGELRREGAQVLAGVDEVGRGAWAGPVSVGVVMLEDLDSGIPEGICDSKMLTRPQRNALVPAIHSWAAAWGVGHASSSECDVLGMRGAIAVATSRAIEASGVIPDAIICDGPLDLLGVETLEVAALTKDHAWRHATTPMVRAVVKGDQHCATVAAASILAKVARDDLMGELGVPEAFGFDSNAGYPAPKHLAALEEFGLTSFHRQSWSFAERYRMA